MSEERAWWVFELPTGARSHVPSSSEDDARRALARHSYRDAPVGDWPLVATRVCSRQALVASLMRPR